MTGTQVSLKRRSETSRATEQPAFVRNFLFQSGNASARGSAGMPRAAGDGHEGTCGQFLAAGVERSEDAGSCVQPSQRNGQVQYNTVSMYLVMWQQTPRPWWGIQPPRVPFPLRPCSETAGTESLASSHRWVLK